VTERYDVVAIGAGPAGAVAAHGAARRGLDVLLLDRALFPRYKVCGCCLNARALGALDRAGLGDVVAGLKAVDLTRLEVHASTGVASMALTGSAGLSRNKFDEALVARARKAGAVFRDGVSATMGEVCGTDRKVHLRDREGARSEVRAGLVLVADGVSGSALRGHSQLGSHVRPGSRIGAGTILSVAPRTYRTGVVTLACGRRGYVGTVRIEDGRLDVAAALDPGLVNEAGGTGPAAAKILDEAGMPSIPALVDAAWRGTPALTRRRKKVAGEGFLILGDAAGYVEPFTGEGIAWALEGAVALNWDGDPAREWPEQYRRLVRSRQWGCRAVASLLRHPRLLHHAIGLADRNPRVAAPLVRRLTQPLSG